MSASPLNDEILAAVNEVQSPDSRIVLTLLARVHGDILTRLDRIYADEQRIKSIALNGLTDTHHSDHDWLARNRPGLEMAGNLARERAALGGLCEYAARKSKEEDEAKTTRRVILSSVAEKMTISAVSIIATLLVMGVLYWMDR